MMRLTLSLALALGLVPILRAGPLEEAQAAFRAGDYFLAASIAEAAAQARPSDMILRDFHALSLNALGVQQADAGQWREAMQSLEAAAALKPQDEVVRENWHRAIIRAAVAQAQEDGEFRAALALLEQLPQGLNADLDNRRRHAASLIELLWARQSEDLGHSDEQRGHLVNAIEWQPDNVAALVDLSEWHYGAGDFEEALTVGRRALAIDRDIPALVNMMRTIDRDRQVLDDHVIQETPHFAISRPQRGESEFVTTCQMVLEQAYTRISQEFHHWPGQRFHVVIYDEREFRGVLDAPSWAQAAFDGRMIRVYSVPVRTNAQRRGLQDTISHELTHAFVFNLAGSRCPMWLNEGLAQRCEINRRISANDRLQVRQWRDEGLLPSIAEMPGDFSVYQTHPEALRAYRTSLLFTDDLVNRYGGRRVREVLEDIGAGIGIEEAVENRLNRSLEELDRTWRDSL